MSTTSEPLSRPATVSAEAKVRLVLWEDEGGRVAASSGGGVWELPPGSRSTAAGGTPLRSRAARDASSVWARCTRSGRRRGVAACPLAAHEARDQGRGHRLPATCVSRPLRLARSVASQVSLALDAASLAETSTAKERSPFPLAGRTFERSDHRSRRTGVVTYQSPSIERLLVESTRSRVSVRQVAVRLRS